MYPQRAEPLPEFDNPPVVEMALSIQFPKLSSLMSPQFGIVWQAFKDRFPTIEEQPPLEPTYERFGLSGSSAKVRIELLHSLPRPRVWMIDEGGSELVQLQQDRFIRNWRKMGNGEYPSYDRLRDFFRNDAETFIEVIRHENLGDITPNQCEVTYVNLISVDTHGDFEQVITTFSTRYSDDYLSKPEEVSLAIKYILHDKEEQPIGRLHITATAVRNAADNSPAIRLTLTARGRPLGSGVHGVMSFFDLAHEAIVRGFASITTKEMHKHWRRRL